MDIEQDLSFQHREWRRERIGWVVIGLILLAGLLGLFGHHPFARATSQTAKGQLTVEYDRFASIRKYRRVDGDGQTPRQG